MSVGNLPGFVAVPRGTFWCWRTMSEAGMKLTLSSLTDYDVGTIPGLLRGDLHGLARIAGVSALDVAEALVALYEGPEVLFDEDAGIFYYVFAPGLSQAANPKYAKHLNDAINRIPSQVIRETARGEYQRQYPHLKGCFPGSVLPPPAPRFLELDFPDPYSDGVPRDFRFWENVVRDSPNPMTPEERMAMREAACEEPFAVRNARRQRDRENMERMGLVPVHV